MNKKLLSLFLGFGLLCSQSLFAIMGEDVQGLVYTGMRHSVMRSSGVVFSGGGTIWKVVLSTGIDNSEWMQIFDTSTQFENYGYAAISSTQMAIPPVIFRSTSTTNIGFAFNNEINFAPYGVLITTGCYLYLAPGVITNTRPVAIYYTK